MCASGAEGRMYSLYRAWFGGEESYPRLETLSPPDTLVRVGNDGEYHFVAHRSVLAAHSGYLKALLAATAAAGPAGSHEAASQPAPAPPLIASITVPPSIGGEAFAPLLNYMYTGRLEVTLDNIYTVLLATHLLHMPGALEQCRAALLRLRGPAVPGASGSPPAAASAQSASVLRPVPNRLLGPAFYWPQAAPGAAHLYPPPRHLELPHLPALQLPAALTVLPGPLGQKPGPYGPKERSLSPASSCSQPAHQQPAGSRSPLTSPELVVASSASSLTQRSDEQQPATRGPSPSASSERISIGDESQPMPQQQQQQQQQQSRQTTTTPPPRRRRASHKRSSRQTERSSSSSSTVGTAAVAVVLPCQTPGVVYDVACCDGPVRFHRVLNENYAPAAAQAQQPSQPGHRVLMAQCNGRASAEEAAPGSGRENDENEHRPAQPQSASASLNNNGESRSGSYTCGYCQHTFKSQYCYRKHARRHLLPTEGESAESRQLTQQQQQQQQQPPTTRPPTPSPAAPAPAPQESKKREVRLLDLNVQYYPCKICGSKFPSYYFVHKHRKLCHANVEEPASRSNSSNSTDEQPRAKSAQPQLQSQQQPSTSESVQQPA